MESASKILISFTAGVVAGAVFGMLVAPASGEDTREKFGRITHDSIDNFLEKAERGLGFARDILNEMHENQIHTIS